MLLIVSMCLTAIVEIVNVSPSSLVYRYDLDCVACITLNKVASFLKVLKCTKCHQLDNMGYAYTGIFNTNFSIKSTF